MAKWPLGVVCSIDEGLGVHLDVAHQLQVGTCHLHSPSAASRTPERAAEFKQQLADLGIEVTVVFAGFAGESYADIPTVVRTVGLVPPETREVRTAEMLEIADFFASVAEWDDTRDRFVIRGVIGPDEYHTRYPGAPEPGLDNNAYTNVMAAWVLRRALDVLAVLPPRRHRELCHQLDLDDERREHWRRVSTQMYVPFLAPGLIEQLQRSAGHAPPKPRHS